jgi:pimeloyl-ACP methyl ester carboxylesterase
MRRISTFGLCACLALVLWALAGSHRANATTSSCETEELKPFGGKLQTGSVPILFVHGITGDPSIFTHADRGGGASIAARVRGIPGATVWTFDYHKASLDWVTDKAIGPALAKSISCLARVSRKRVVVIAHSMGGLATQYAAAQRDPQGGIEGERIAHVFAIGTPFKGSKLLSAAQDALRGVESPDHATSAAMQALLSECAGAGEAAYAVVSGDPCGILSVLRSPVGADLQFDSPEIAALPRWPADVPVTDIAASIDVNIGIWKVRHTVDVGDLAVSQDSATAHETSGASIQIVCHDALRTLLDTACYHGWLPRDPGIVRTIAQAARRIVQVERATFAPSTFGGIQWRDYFPVREGRQCVLETEAHFGDITSEARQTQTTTHARFQAQGVYFLQHAVTVASAVGTAPTTTTLNLPYLLADDGTLQVTPGLSENSKLKYLYKGFEVYPPLAALRRGDSLRSKVTMTVTGATPKITKLLAQATHSTGGIAVELGFDVKAAPRVTQITTPAGTFDNPVGVSVSGVGVHVLGAPSGTDKAVDQLFAAFVGKHILTYFARGVGPVMSKTDGLFGGTVRLLGCSG